MNSCINVFFIGINLFRIAKTIYFLLNKNTYNFVVKNETTITIILYFVVNYVYNIALN